MCSAGKGDHEEPLNEKERVGRGEGASAKGLKPVVGAVWAGFYRFTASITYSTPHPRLYTFRRISPWGQ